MRRLFESGFAFMIVALLCFAAAIAGDSPGPWVGIGGFWMIMAVIVRGKNVKKGPDGT